MNDSSGEPVVRPDELGVSQTDVSGSEFGIGAPTSEEVQRKRCEPKPAVKNPLAAVLESWLLSLLQCRLLVKSVANFSFFFAGDAENVPRVSGNEDVSTDVETDGHLKGVT